VDWINVGYGTAGVIHKVMANTATVHLLPTVLRTISSEDTQNRPVGDTSKPAS